MVNKFLIIILLLFKLNYSYSQENKCPITKFGYLIHYYQKPTSYVSCSSDYFFFDKLPNIDSVKNYSFFLRNGGEIVDVGYYESKYLGISISDNIDVLSFKKTIYKEKKMANSNLLDIYKVLMVYDEKETLLNVYTSQNNLPAEHSFLEDIKEKEKKIKVFYPVVICTYK